MNLIGSGIRPRCGPRGFRVSIDKSASCGCVKGQVSQDVKPIRLTAYRLT